MSRDEFILKSISPIDGRYRNKTSGFSDYFSEYALIKYRVYIEIKYFLELCNKPIKNLDSLSKKNKSDINNIYKNFNVEDAKKIKKIEN